MVDGGGEQGGIVILKGFVGVGVREVCHGAFDVIMLV